MKPLNKSKSYLKATKSGRSGFQRNKGVHNRSNPKSHTNFEFKPTLKTMPGILVSIYDGFDSTFYNECVLIIRDLVTSLVRENGYNEGIKRYKILRSYTFDLMEGRNPENPAFVATTKRRKFIRAFGLINQLVAKFIETENLACYQAINTILYIPRIIQGYTEADLSPVTEKACVIDPELIKEFDTYVSETLKGHQFDPSKVLNLNNLSYKVNKKGPNGKPKLERADDEAFALQQSKLWHPFKRLAANLGVPYLSEYVEQLAVDRKDQLGDKASVKLANTKIRVLAFVPDSELKTRIVAIPDFWTQLVLEPFRAHVNMVIQRLFSAYDFVENQDLGFETLQRVQKDLSDEEKKHLFSFDFSDWTTRYHRDLQKITVRHLFSGPISEAWSQLVVHCNWDIPKLRTSVKFGQGQGMGTNGSFPVATLTDHLFINFIYMKCKEVPNYGKIGDDLWIHDPQDVFPSYYEKINLPVNFGKTKRYSEHLNVPISEFASRVTIDGFDVSRLSPNVINKSKDWRSIPTLLAVAQKRNIAISPSHLPSLQNNLRNDEVTYFEKLEEVLYSLSWLKESVLNLDRDYLKSNGWLTEKYSFLSQPEKQVKFQLSFAILQIARNHCLVEDKAKEVFDVTRKHGLDEVRQLVQDDSPVWDKRSTLHQRALGIIPGSEGREILSPKQVIALCRYKTQWELITTKLSDLHNLDGGSVEDIIVFAQGLQDIANRSNYDNGVIAYDTKTWKNTVFSVIQVLQQLDLEKDELWFKHPDQLDLINSIIESEYLPICVSKLLPTLRVLTVDSVLASSPTLDEPSESNEVNLT